MQRNLQRKSALVTPRTWLEVVRIQLTPRTPWRGPLREWWPLMGPPRSPLRHWWGSCAHRVWSADTLGCSTRCCSWTTAALPRTRRTGSRRPRSGWCCSNSWGGTRWSSWQNQYLYKEEDERLHEKAGHRSMADGNPVVMTHITPWGTHFYMAGHPRETSIDLPTWVLNSQFFYCIELMDLRFYFHRVVLAIHLQKNGESKRTSPRWFRYFARKRNY